MKKILYIVDCCENPNVSCSFIHSLSNDNNQAILLFNNSIHRDMYKNYLSTNLISNVTFLDTNYDNISLSDITQKYLSTHEWFAFLSPYVLYTKDFAQELIKLCENNKNNETVIAPSNTKNKKTYSVIFNRDSIKEYIRQGLSYYQLLQNKHRIILFHFNNYFPILNGTSWYDIEKAYNDSSNVYYNDEFCIFAKFLAVDDISDSFVYINKKNYRIYNIANNLVGEIKNANNNNLSIHWHRDSKSEFGLITYTFDNLNKYYLPTS